MVMPPNPNAVSSRDRVSVSLIRGPVAPPREKREQDTRENFDRVTPTDELSVNQPSSN